MKPIKLVVRIHSAGFIGIGDHGIEIDNTVIGSGITNPVVHSQPSCFMEMSVIIRIAELGDSSAIYFEPLLTSFCNHRLVGFNKLPGCIFAFRRPADVVDTFKNHHCSEAVLAEDVAVIAFHGRFAQSSVNHAIATDSKIKHSHFSIESLSENVGPAVLPVGSSTATVGNRIADYGDAGFPFHIHFKSGDIVPMLQPFRRLERFFRFRFPFHYIA